MVGMNEHSIKKGIAFLEKAQQKDGSFLSYSTAQYDDFTNAIPYRTVFTSALILNALKRCNNPKANSIKDRLAQFLLKQKSKNWTYNYWNRQALEYNTLPYPDDLDDTFCALAAL